MRTVRHYIITLNFMAAFDKAPYSFVIKTLAKKETSGNILSYYASFQMNRIQQIKVDNTFSAMDNVLLWVMQESVFGLRK